MLPARGADGDLDAVAEGGEGFHELATGRLAARLRMNKKQKEPREISSHEERAMGQRFSLRKPTTSQERSGKKRRRLAPFEMTVWRG